MVPRPVPQLPPQPELPQFYAGRNIFITGATGFMGKVLVERLLSTCPDIGELYLLMRRKKDVSPEKRLVHLKQSQVFDVVRVQCPTQLEKLRIVPGDITAPGLGLDLDSIAQLQEVSIVFHSAAMLKFDEPLEKAVEQNVRSVIRLMDLCDTLPNIQAFVHVSTAYSNTEHTVVEERVYPAPAQLQHVLEVTDALPPHILAEITNKYIAPKPNTYTFTKAIAESAVQQRAGRRYPVAIFRPSIVISALKHPFPGWIENLNGPSGAIVGVGKGLLHVMDCSMDVRTDMIPVDIAIDTLIAVAYETAVDKGTQIRVYNCSSCENLTTFRQFKAALIRGVRTNPFDTPLWYPFGLTTENRFINKILETMLQTIPLYTVDYIAKLCGIKMRFSCITACERLRAMTEVLRFFGLHEWHFANDNVRRLRDRLSPQDRELYNLDPRTIQWEEHFAEFVKGTRRYLLKEKDENLPDAKRRMRRLYFLHTGLIWVAAAFLIKLLMPGLLHNVLNLRLYLSYLPWLCKQ